MQGHKTKTKTKDDELGLQLNLLHCVLDRMCVDEGNVQVIDDVDVILENCPMTIIPLRYILTSSDYDVCNSHYILH